MRFFLHSQIYAGDNTRTHSPVSTLKIPNGFMNIFFSIFKQTKILCISIFVYLRQYMVGGDCFCHSILRHRTKQPTNQPKNMFVVMALFLFAYITIIIAVLIQTTLYFVYDTVVVIQTNVQPYGPQIRLFLLFEVVGQGQ